jgi:hypothetical protein
MRLLRVDLAEKRRHRGRRPRGVRKVTAPEIFLGINAACCVLFGVRCWYLEGRVARLTASAPPLTPDDMKATRVWKARKPTVFHRRRA